MRWIHQPIYLVLLIISAPFLLLARGAYYVPTLKSRFLGPNTDSDGKNSLWIHAVSVGEVGVAAVLARNLPALGRVTLTTVTPTGQRSAERLLGSRIELSYLPFDLFLPIKRFLRWAQPVALVLVEGDYWPFLLSTLRRREIPAYVINGRISDRSFRRLQRLPRFLTRAYFGSISRFGVQSQQDMDRLIQLGVDNQRIEVTGNLKFDTPIPSAESALEFAIQRFAGTRPILIAGSCMEGEEQFVLDALEQVSAKTLLILAPRHPERGARVLELCAKRGYRAVLRSQLDDPQQEPMAKNVDIVVLDSVGELASLYRVAQASFVGGTLVPTGGHNPLEPAVFGVPIAVGPSMENFRTIAEVFDRTEAWKRVSGAQELGDTWQAWLDHPRRASQIGERAQRLVQQGRGALADTLRFLEPIIARWQTPQDSR